MIGNGEPARPPKRALGAVKPLTAPWLCPCCRQHGQTVPPRPEQVYICPRCREHGHRSELIVLVTA